MRFLVASLKFELIEGVMIGIPPAQQSAIWPIPPWHLISTEWDKLTGTQWAAGVSM